MRYLGIAGVFLIPLGYYHVLFSLIGMVCLGIAMKDLLDRAGHGDYYIKYLIGLAPAIVGGYWLRGILGEEEIGLLYLTLFTVLVVGGIYLQSVGYAKVSEHFKSDELALGGYLLTVGSALALFYVGLPIMALAVLLMAYGFYRIDV
ncbi:hypothetical protein [Thermocrinis minervae]|uniref:Uncharacterized protein n=1 Tax=Thermocrinis minervae TaxID=381751 RepID=A0A1M6RPM0_9AQUI|nr:hypothetical protein [Thermocrinis minervae]SHK34409.1 hypothetical protein SAMN05444391_0726 [Thermocrinis minervae]